MRKERVDVLLVKLGLVESRSLAQRLIMAGQVRANGQVVQKPSTMLPEGAELEVESGARFVSRGGEKLEFAIQTFNLDILGKVCADVGASTGGFTDCLLQHGAAKVYAIDVGKGILRWKLRQDPRVVVMEDTNARHLEGLSESVDMITIDASFISLKLLLPIVCRWFTSSDSSSSVDDGSIGLRGEVVALIKPQFEAGRREAARGEGVIRDPAIHQRVLLEVLSFAQDNGYRVCDLARSPLLGPKGNVEFLVYLVYPGIPKEDLELFVEAVLASL